MFPNAVQPAFCSGFGSLHFNPFRHPPYAIHPRPPSWGGCILALTINGHQRQQKTSKQTQSPAPALFCRKRTDDEIGTLLFFFRLAFCFFWLATLFSGELTNEALCTPRPKFPTGDRGGGGRPGGTREPPSGPLPCLAWCSPRDCSANLDPCPQHAGAV
ncbi:hypothetical protein B0T25DRAFT_541625 [Lasiosphaeria hispida]|uniref:Uncharacterized protein n=1 Tax=Lasiosphaeria hispida TaxID=260671 RepID=A0AAJ0HH35_9PEZI|nr:hypothetical protein B0T25DRAFT_541625 [Lasiosphaeria hispida]